MPILEIELVGPVPDDVRDGLARRVADAAGDALDAPPGGTWVRLRFLAERDYAESGGDLPDGVRPVFVSILLADPPEGEARGEQARRLTRAVAGACGRPPENVHVLYEPAARGRVAFGGSVR